jgi:hypothetical protein
MLRHQKITTDINSYTQQLRLAAISYLQVAATTSVLLKICKKIQVGGYQAMVIILHMVNAFLSLFPSIKRYVSENPPLVE